MKKKSLFVTVLLVVFLCSTYAQAEKLKCTSYSSRELNYETGQLADWSEWEDCKFLMTVDAEDERINIYGSEQQVYDIFTIEEECDQDGNTIFRFTCLDKNGYNCTVKLMKWNNTGAIQVYVMYYNMQMVYNVNTLS